MGRSIIDLMHACVVKLTTPLKEGSGFFVAPDLILTCAHVVEGDTFERCYQRDITVRWKNNFDFAIARVKAKEYLPDPLDIALLECISKLPETPPCVLLGDGCNELDNLATYGYPHELENAESAMFVFSGDTGDTSPFMKFQEGRVKPGMSGAPLFNMDTNQVCGMVKFSDDTASAYAGGGGIPSATILRYFGQLKDLQDQYHRQEPKWYSEAGIRLPGVISKTSLSIAEDLTKKICMEITKILKDPKLQFLVEEISRIYKEQGEKVATVCDVASKLVSSDVYQTQLLLLRARQESLSALESAAKTKDDLKWLYQRVLKIIGWQILLAVNRDYISENGDKLNQKGFYGAISLPVQKDSSIEVVHAALNGQCAEFELIEMKNEGGKSEEVVVGKTRMDDEVIPENGPRADIKVDEIIECLFEYLINPIQKPPKEEMIEEIQAELEAWHAKKQVRYLVVRTSARGNPLNDNQVLQKLFNDLGDELRIIFHDTNRPAKEIFNVSEIKFNRNLVHFLDIQ